MVHQCAVVAGWKERAANDLLLLGPLGHENLLHRALVRVADVGEVLAHLEPVLVLELSNRPRGSEVQLRNRRPLLLRVYPLNRGQLVGQRVPRGNVLELLEEPRLRERPLGHGLGHGRVPRVEGVIYVVGSSLGHLLLLDVVRKVGYSVVIRRLERSPNVVLLAVRVHGQRARQRGNHVRRDGRRRGLLAEVFILKDVLNCILVRQARELGLPVGLRSARLLLHLAPETRVGAPLSYYGRDWRFGPCSLSLVFMASRRSQMPLTPPLLLANYAR